MIVEQGPTHPWSRWHSTSSRDLMEVYVVKDVHSSTGTASLKQSGMRVGRGLSSAGRPRRH